MEKGGLDLDAIWHHRSDGSRNETRSVVCRSVHGKGYFWGRICGAPHNVDFTAYVSNSALTIGPVVWGGACSGPGHCGIRWGSTSCKGKGRFWGFLFPIFTMGNATGSPTVKCFRFVCENLTTFPFGKRIVVKLDLWALWRYIRLQDQRRGL